jgi:hypothetical protein
MNNTMQEGEGQTYMDAKVWAILVLERKGKIKWNSGAKKLARGVVYDC